MVLPVLAKEALPSGGRWSCPCWRRNLPKRGDPGIDSEALAPSRARRDGGRAGTWPAADPPPEASRAAEGTLLLPLPLPAATLPEARAATVPTAAEIIRETLPEEPAPEASTIRVTQANLPELRMPELPEMTPPASPPPAEPPPLEPTVALAAPRI